MKKVLTILGAVFVAFLAFVGLLHGVLIIRHRHTPEAMNAFHDWPVIGGFFPKHVVEETPPSPDERRAKDAALWLQDVRNEFRLPPPFTTEQVETLVRELKDARSQAEAAKMRYEADHADLDRVKKEVESNRQAVNAAGDTVISAAKKLEADRDEVFRERRFVEKEEIKNLKTLSSMYEAMPAEEAAKKLLPLDDDTAARLLAQMGERKAGRILAAMDTPRAVLITKKLQVLPSDKPSGPATVIGSTKR